VAKDRFHQIVKMALIRDGWQVTHDPLQIKVPDLTYNSFFQLDFPASMLQENTVKLIIYDVELEQIVLWKH
jgi:hypothetical protein